MKSASRAVGEQLALLYGSTDDPQIPSHHAVDEALYAMWREGRASVRGGHYAQTTYLLAGIHGGMEGETGTADIIALAQVHATLALIESRDFQPPSET